MLKDLSLCPALNIPFLPERPLWRVALNLFFAINYSLRLLNLVTKKRPISQSLSLSFMLIFIQLLVSGLGGGAAYFCTKRDR
jgi:hypothetical protein